MTHLVGCAPFVVIAVIRLSSSSRFSLSFFTRLSIARLLKLSDSPPWNFDNGQFNQTSNFLTTYTYQNRFFLGYYFIKHRKRLRERLRKSDDPELDTSSNYEYDVFVSYSNEETGWVNEKLLPMLGIFKYYMAKVMKMRDIILQIKISHLILYIPFNFPCNICVSFE